jgi:alpha-glucosidase
MVADYPTAYEEQAGFDFLKLVPTWWDETRVLAARPGELLVTARRKGNLWYVGGMAAKNPQELDLPLSLLGAARYTARIWRDAGDAAADPNRLVNETLTLSAVDTLKVHLALDGGFVAELTRAER